MQIQLFIEKANREYRALNSPWKDHIIAHNELQIALFFTLIKSTKPRFGFPEPCVGNYWYLCADVISYFMTAIRYGVLEWGSKKEKKLYKIIERPLCFSVQRIQ